MIEVVVGKASHPRSKKHVHLLPEELRWEVLSTEEVATLASTPSFLGGPHLFLLTGALSGPRGDEFLALAAGLADSPHTFIFEEEKLLKKPLDALKKKGISVEILLESKKDLAAKTVEPFNVFSIAHAFASRDRKTFWLSLVAAARAEVAPEALAGMLHWKVRDLLAKGGGKYTKAELREISREIVSLYHDAHRGEGALELLLERFALRV